MKAMKIHSSDQVAIALEALKKGEQIPVDGENVLLLEDIPFAHKFALRDINEKEAILKYGEVFGISKCPIQKGQWVHTHNVKNPNLDNVGYQYQWNDNTVCLGNTDRTFMGYERKNGQVGIRNYIAIIPTVFCCNGPADKLANMMSIKYPNTSNFDGFQILKHSSGCGQCGDDLNLVSKILANLSKNPNFGGVLFLSLGCEPNDLKQMAPYIGEYDSQRVKFLTLQEVEDEYIEGCQLIEQLYQAVSKDARTPVSISKLCIGFNCGGSDGFSGITANRLVGDFADKLTSLGATTNFTEIPEIFGAEHILMNRCKNKEIFDKMVEMVNNYKAYFKKYGQSPEDNPTQGNHEGGITTLAEKSLGCIKKGGTSMVMDIVAHGDRIKENGLNLIIGPGHDLNGITAQVAAGSVLILFTTGRGTPCGFIGPTFRLSTNNVLYQKKPGWNDFNAGRLLNGENPSTLAEELFEKVLETCEGNYRTKNEENGFYQMAIFKDGVTD